MAQTVDLQRLWPIIQMLCDRKIQLQHRAIGNFEVSAMQALYLIYDGRALNRLPIDVPTVCFTSIKSLRTFFFQDFFEKLLSNEVFNSDENVLPMSTFKAFNSLKTYNLSDLFSLPIKLQLIIMSNSFSKCFEHGLCLSPGLYRA